MLHESCSKWYCQELFISHVRSSSCVCTYSFVCVKLNGLFLLHITLSCRLHFQYFFLLKVGITPGRKRRAVIMLKLAKSNNNFFYFLFSFYCNTVTNYWLWFFFLNEENISIIIISLWPIGSDRNQNHYCWTCSHHVGLFVLKVKRAKHHLALSLFTKRWTRIIRAGKLKLIWWEKTH